MLQPSALHKQFEAHTQREIFLLTLIIVIFAFSTTAPNPASALQTDVPLDQALVLAGGESTNPRSFDPPPHISAGDKRVFSGLVSFDPSLNLTPDLAERWEVSPDGTVYTFYLRQNAKFHDGRPVTAQDVVYSWERAASPALASDTVLTYLGDIVGVREMTEGKADHISGLKIIDDHTCRSPSTRPSLTSFSSLHLQLLLFWTKPTWKAARNGIAHPMAPVPIN